MNVLLFGPPGSGKGTQAQALAAMLSVPHVSTGDIFRRHLRESTPLGQLARSYMDRGALVPDQVTCDLVATRLVEPDAVGGVLYDGFPRSVPQLEWLVGFLAAREQRVDAVVNLLVRSELLLARISGRRSCPGCGASYHVTTNPTQVDGVCDRCGAAVVQRKDDAEDVVRDRLATYERDTAPVLGAVLSTGSIAVYDIDGVGMVDEVRARIFAALRLG
jgi:adenylate kinase